jgi:hypothetical protein
MFPKNRGSLQRAGFCRRPVAVLSAGTVAKAAGIVIASTTVNDAGFGSV